MRRAAARGARFVFVNPRRIETPEQGIGDTLLIRPDTDVWFLAALLHEIDRLGGFDPHVLDRHGANVEGLRAFVAPYSPDAVDAVTGVAADDVRELAAAWVATPRASVHASTGINMGRQGTLAYWLVHMLSFVTGSPRRRGRQPQVRRLLPQRRVGRSRHGADVHRHRVRTPPPRRPARRADGRRHPRQRRSRSGR